MNHTGPGYNDQQCAWICPGEHVPEPMCHGDLSRDLILLLLLGWSNFLPILGRRLLGDRLSAPVDMGGRFPDGRDLFGPHKTWRGLAFSVAGTAAVAYFTPFGAGLGARLAAWSMAGDLASSFMKRRLGLASGARAIGLDQGLEALVPLWLLRGELGISHAEALGIAVVFAVLELVVSPVLYWIRLRRNPH